MPSFTKKEKRFLKSLNTPAKVQDFLNSIPFNFEKNGLDTLKSPLLVLREKDAHCIEGAIFAAYVLSLHGQKPEIVFLKSSKKDLDHVIAIFREGRRFGAISKTNHAVLRFREPVYKSLRELVMSYFHEYFLDDGTKTLRAYSKPLDLNIFESGWEVAEEDLWGIDEELDKMKLFDIFEDKKPRFRKADKIEVEAGKIVEWEIRFF